MNASVDGPVNPGSVFEALRSGETVSDSVFDQIYSEEIRRLSEIHWTPVSIAKRAAELLVRDANTRVLDVGSGCGKFCLVGGLTTTGSFYGIEQREKLALCARSLAEGHRLERVQFLSGDLKEVDWSRFDAFYLYNPFNENLYPNEIRIDGSVELSERRYVQVIRAVQARLHVLPAGTRVVTYHGFGGEMPPGYAMIFEEPRGEDYLRLWVKVAGEQS